MSITDELREWVTGAKPAVVDGCSVSVGTMTYGCKKALLAIADRIDAEHQKALDEWKAKHGQMWLKGYAECHAELLEGNETLASDLESCGWIRLPKDVDNLPIRIGDVMENIVCPSVHREVTGVGVECFYGWDEGNGRYSQFDANRYRHHHAPTVEDVLEDFYRTAKADSDANMGDLYETIAEYAKRLTLAEGEEA